MKNNRLVFIRLLLAGLFVAWAARFIYHSSLVAVNGQRYFSLFDDAMISMRYAWNFAHGHGLAWNPGERVEGYTNLLMVLIMAVPNAVLEPRFAVLSVQVFGIVTLIGIAVLTGQIAVLLAPVSIPACPRAVIRLGSFAAALLYYPLVYWSLMGMETGLLALLVLAALWAALKFEQTGRVGWARGMALPLGLAYLTRPEALALGGLLVLYVWGASRGRFPNLPWVGHRPAPTSTKYGGARVGEVNTTPPLHWREMALIGVLFVALPLAQHIFRWVYYDGALFANTYTLKAEGLPVRERIGYGWDYTVPFLREHALLLVVAAAGVALRFSRARLLLVFLVAGMIAYQIFVGGDVPAWTYWRLVAPVMPLVLILAINAPFDLYARRRSRLVLAAAGVVVVVAFGLAVERFRDEMLLRVPPYQASLNGVNVNTALLIEAATTPDASLGLFWAGTIPYYNPDHYAIDYLGKSDPYIAGLDPLPDDPMRGWPGHNKHDLAYSIQTLQPTYTEEFTIGSYSIRDWGRTFYAALVYDRDTTLFFKLDDPAVNYEGAFAAGLFPWMQWNIDPYFEHPPEGVILMPANTLNISAPVATPDQLPADALADWQRTRQPADLRAAGVDYVLVDHGWWGALTDAERAILSDPANYELAQEWRVHYVFLRLYRALSSPTP